MYNYVPFITTTHFKAMMIIIPSKLKVKRSSLCESSIRKNNLLRSLVEAAKNGEFWKNLVAGLRYRQRTLQL
jgi:hypothetical protein